MSEPIKRYAQAGAIPIMDGKICLVTSHSGKRWVIPKGIIDPGMTAEQTALQESWEEAGLRGELDGEAVGNYEYEKWGGVCRVTVFVMRVTEASDEWPEAGFRERRWFSADDAIVRIAESKLQRMISQLSKS